MATAAEPAEELLELPRCRAVLIGAVQADVPGESEEVAPVVQFAEGILRILKFVSSDDAPPRFVLMIADAAATDFSSVSHPSEGGAAGGFYYPILPETPVCKAGGMCLTLPDVDTDDSFGIIFDDGGLDAAILQLEACGCRTWQQTAPSVVTALAEASMQGTAPPSSAAEHGKAATLVAGTVTQAASVATGAIKLGADALSWGIRAATASAKQSPLMEPTSKPVAVPAAAQKSVSKAREVSKGVVYVSGAAMDGVAQLAGSLAGKATAASAARAPSGGSSQWVGDAKFVGGSSLEAGVSVFLALNQAADQLMHETLGSTSELVGHKFGEEAGQTTREGFHVAGNLMAAKTLLSKKAVAKVVGKKAAVSAAQSTLSASGYSQPSPAPARAVSGGIRLGPQ